MCNNIAMNAPKITDVLSYFNIDAHDCILEDCVEYIPDFIIYRLKVDNKNYVLIKADCIQDDGEAMLAVKETFSVSNNATIISPRMGAADLGDGRKLSVYVDQPNDTKDHLNKYMLFRIDKVS